MSKYYLLQYLENPKSWTELAHRETLLHFSTSIVAKHQKNEGGTLWGFFFEKKSYNAKKTERGPLVSPGVVCYEKEGKPFWFSSLGQMIQYMTIKFRRIFRTLLVSSCGLKKK